MANTEPFRTVANLFGICISKAWSTVVRVSSWLITIGHEYISWPKNYDAVKVADAFQEKGKIPGVLGAIDCSHIKIKRPKEHGEAYFNRKKFYSIHLQAVVDSELMFRDIHVGEPGSMHDSRVLRRSPLYQRSVDTAEQVFPNSSFLIGDSAYPILQWIIPPYRDNGTLTQRQKRFNTLLSSSRIVVENAFGLMKTRFRRLLHFTEQKDLNFVINLVTCGCILHNICMIQSDLIEYSPEIVSSEPSTQASEVEENNTNRREILIEYLASQNII